MHRTSPSYASYSTRGEGLEKIEMALVEEVTKFDNQYLVLFGYNDQNKMIDNFKILIERSNVKTTEYSLIVSMIV